MSAPALRLLKPDVLSRLGTLDLIARTVVDGLLTGMHRSPNFGFSQEFAEYRAYNEGDDLRFVDWNVYARTDRTYIKRFRGETNSQVMLLLDASGSMGFGEDHTKLDYARYLLASLAYLVKRQHDALGMAVFDEGVREWLQPSSKPDSLVRTLGLLERTESAEGTDLNVTLKTFQANHSKRGLVVVASDFYTDTDELLRALQPLVHGGQDIAVFHILDPGEIDPDIKTISALADLESDETVIVDPEFMQNGYRKAFAAHRADVERACSRLGADYVLMTTDQPLDQALQQYLRFRERRQR